MMRLTHKFSSQPRLVAGACRHWLTILLFWLSLLAPPAMAAGPAVVTLASDATQIALGRHVQVLEDQTGKLSFEQVLAADAQFHPSLQTTPNFGFSRSVYWFRVRLDNHHPQQRDWLLENQYPLLDHFDLYTRTADGRVLHVPGGRALPFSTRQVVHPNLIFRLALDYRQPTDIYLRVETGSSLQLPLVLWHPERFAASGQDQQRLFAAFYGMLLAMFAFNLLLFLSLREPSYGYYVLYVGTFGLFQFSLNGLGFEYLWPESPRWGQASIPLFLALSLVAMFHFSRLFLNLQRNLPRVNRLLRSVQWLLLLVPLALLLVDYSPVIRLVTLIGLLSSIVICLSGWFVWLRCQLPQARYFVFAWTCLLAGMLFYALKTINVLPANFFTNYSLQIGAGLEVLLLSFALAHRLKILEAEHERMQREYAEQLVDKVNERTAQLDRAMQRLVAANQELEAFSYTVSHDLRAPLRAISGFSQILQEDCSERLDEEHQQHLARIQNATTRMSELIDALLELAKITRSELKTESIDLSALAQEVLADLLSLYPQRQVEVVVAPGMLDRGDRKLLRNVLQNLLGNALKFSAEKAQSRIEFSAAQRDGKTVYRVCDNGAGFDMRYVGRLFGAFQRLHDEKQFEGTGIGLASVQRIIHRHGGDVWAEGTPGQGACFYFTLH